MPLTEEDLQWINGQIARYHKSKDEQERREIKTHLYYMDIIVKEPIIPIQEYDDGA